MLAARPIAPVVGAPVFGEIDGIQGLVPRKERLTAHPQGVAVTLAHDLTNDLANRHANFVAHGVRLEPHRVHGENGTADPPRPFPTARIFQGALHRVSGFVRHMGQVAREVKAHASARLPMRRNRDGYAVELFVMTAVSSDPMSPASSASPSQPSPAPTPMPMPVPRVWTAFLALPVAFLVACLATLGVMCAGLVVGIARSASPSVDDIPRIVTTFSESPIGLSLVTFGYGFALTITCLVLAHFSSQSAWTRLRISRHGALAPHVRGGVVRLTAVVVITGVALSFGYGFVLSFLPGRPGGTLEMLTRSIMKTSPVERVFAALAIGPVTALGEELLFRGFIQSRLEARWGAARAIAIASSLFALAHFDVHQGIYALLAGVLYGGVAARTRSTWPGVLAHATANTLATFSVGLSGNVRMAVGAVALPIALGGAAHLCTASFGARRKQG
jgi:membrane protease YdiL (CAAX protease family)